MDIAQQQGKDLLNNVTKPYTNMLDGVNFSDFIKIQNDSFPNFLIQNIPALSIIGLSIVMYLLGLFSSCMNCSPFRTIILVIYVFILSSVLTYQSVSHICPPKDKITPASFLQFVNPENVKNIIIPSTESFETSTSSAPSSAPSETYTKDDVNKIIQAYETKERTARLSTAIGYAIGVTFVFTLVYILFPLLRYIPISKFSPLSPIFLIIKFLTIGPGSVIFPGILGAVVFYLIQNYAQYKAAKRDCDRIPELQGKNFLFF